MKRSSYRHRVPFYETDAMGIVHHANYVRYLEVARIAWMDEHDRPYREYIADGLHFSTTRVDLQYLRSASFDDVLDVATWIEWVGGASLCMAYDIDRDGQRIAAGITHIVANANSDTPSIGASGAIAGVLAAYLRLFPHARVRCRQQQVRPAYRTPGSRRPSPRSRFQG